MPSGVFGTNLIQSESDGFPRYFAECFAVFSTLLKAQHFSPSPHPTHHALNQENNPAQSLSATVTGGTWENSTRHLRCQNSLEMSPL
jgi:hypothetical protein